MNRYPLNFTWIISAGFLAEFAGITFILLLGNVEIYQRPGVTYAAMLAGLLLPGMFHAKVIDTFRRKHAYLLSMAVMLAGMYGCQTLDGALRMASAALFGAGFGFVFSIGSALHIDVSPSLLRNWNNVVYVSKTIFALMLAKLLVLCNLCYFDLPANAIMKIIYLSVFIGMVCMLFARIPFRAPIGVKLLGNDRFFLPGLWLPALHTALAGAFIGLTYIYALYGGIPSMIWPAIGLLCSIITPVGQVEHAYLRRITHCQRDTAVTTLLVSFYTGILGYFVYYFQVGSEGRIQSNCADLLGALLVLTLVEGWRGYKWFRYINGYE